MRRAATALAAFATVAATAAAAPVVTIKARTELGLGPVRRIPGGVEVAGVLLDRSQGVGVRFADVVVELDGRSRVVRTGDDGAFSLTYPIREGVHTLILRYAGDRQYAPTTAARRGFDVSKDPLTLTIRTSREVGVDDDELLVAVAARTEGGAAAVTVTLSSSEAPGGDLATPLGDATTDADGLARVTVDPGLLGSPGRKRLRAAFAGSDTYDVTSAETELLLTTATELELELASASVRFEDALVATGRLGDARGDAVGRVPVSLLAGSRRVADALTGRDGRFRLRVDAAELGEGPVSIQARFEAAEPWRKSSRSALLTATIGPPQPVPVGYTLAAFAATCVAVAAFALLRTRPWARLRARLRPRGAELVHELGDTSDASEALEPPPAGLVPARPGLMSSIRRPHERGFSGVIVDAVSGAPLPDAELSVELASTPRSARSDASGAFAFADLPEGCWRVRVARVGYCDESFEVRIPHRGELSGARIALVEIREQIFRLYRGAARPLVPDPAHWGIWTPRQIVDYVRAQRPAPALAALTDFIEDAYFSGRALEPAALANANAMVRAAVSETDQASFS